MKFWQAWRNFVPKNTKNFPELQKCWSYNFLNKLMFCIKIDSLATENAILTTVANNFLWESTHLQLRFRKPQKKHWTFRKEKNFPKIVPMYMYKSSCDHPAEIFSSKLWKIFLLDFWKWGKINKPSKKFICKNLRLNMYNEFLTSLP